MYVYRKHACFLTGLHSQQRRNRINWEERCCSDFFVPVLITRINEVGTFGSASSASTVDKEARSDIAKVSKSREVGVKQGARRKEGCAVC